MFDPDTVAGRARGLASPGEVHLRITAKAASLAEADAMIDEMDAKLVSILGDRVFGRDDQTLERVVVESLVARKLTLAIAESCTGGLVANRMMPPEPQVCSK
jgi:nicotinamide-nucleotide amidase